MDLIIKGTPPTVPSDAVVTAGVMKACQDNPLFQGFVHRSLRAFGNGSRGCRIFCKFNEGDLGIAIVRDSGLGKTTVSMEGEY